MKIPIFTTQLEKSREATDAANLRAAYAEQSAALLTWDGTSTITDITVKSKQTQPNWQNTVIDNIGGIKCGNASGDIKAQTGGDAWTIKANTTTNKIEITPVVTP